MKNIVLRIVLRELFVVFVFKIASRLLTLETDTDLSELNETRNERNRDRDDGGGGTKCAKIIISSVSVYLVAFLLILAFVITSCYPCFLLLSLLSSLINKCFIRYNRGEGSFALVCVFKLG